MERAPGWIDRAAPALVGLAAAAVLLPRLSTPGRIFFDETYYVNDARQYLELGGVEASFAVHPPVGKWLIAAGIRVLGDEPAAWRLPGALLAVATVVLLFLVARRLLGSLPAAAGAAMLLLVDGMFVAQARIAMLDIHLVFFVVLAVDLLLRDREARMRGDGHDPPPWWRRPHLLGSGVAIGLAIGTKWSGLFALGAMGLVFLAQELVCRRAARPDPSGTGPAGPSAAEPDTAAVATSLSAAANRWSTPVREDDDGGLADETATAVATADQDAASPQGLVAGPDDPTRADDHAPRRTGLVPAALGTAGAALGALVLVPFVVYALTWVPWLASYVDTTEFPKHCAAAGDVEPPRDAAVFADCDTTLGRRVSGLVGHHRAIWRFHTTLESDHAYLAPATTWPILGRPVVYYYQSCSADRAAGVETTDAEGVVTVPEPCEVAEGDAAEVIALGNPALWWGFLLLAPYLLARAARNDARAAVPLVLWAGQFVPWLLSPRPAFAFYVAPFVPFVALSASAALLLLHERAAKVPRERRETSWALAVGVFFGAVGFLVGVVVGDEETGTALAAVAAVVGVLVAERVDRVVVRDPGSTWANPATLLALAMGVLALGLFVYFLPVWTALPMAEDAVRERWWFSSWI